MPFSQYIDLKTIDTSGRRTREWDLVDAQIRERSFFMAGVTHAQILSEFREKAQKLTQGEYSSAEARALLHDFLKESGYRPKPGEENSIFDLSGSKRMKLVLETNERMAAGWARRRQQLQNPDMPGQELVRLKQRKAPRDWSSRWRAAADAVGWEGVASTGGKMIALLTSPIWKAISRFDLPYPPYDFGSGMGVLPVNYETCVQLGLIPAASDTSATLEQQEAAAESFNHDYSVPASSIAPDMRQQLADALGGLVSMQGDRIAMADINGSRPYTAPELAQVLSRPLPPGVPNLQAKALAAFQTNPSDLLPGGSKHSLLPALRMLARRIRPQAPAALQDWLAKNDEVKNSSDFAGGIVVNSKVKCRSANPTLCSYHHPKGVTRERSPKSEPRRIYKVDQKLPIHKQVRALSNAIKKATRDGAHFEAVITRPEFGELIVDCGRSGRKNDSNASGGHGAKHVAESRHNISIYQAAEALLKGRVMKDKDKPSRLNVIYGKCKVVLEREYKKGSKRFSETRAKLHTAERYNGP